LKLAAGALAAVAAQAVAIAVAAAAEQNSKDDNPPNIKTAAIITHNPYLRNK